MNFSSAMRQVHTVKDFLYQLSKYDLSDNYDSDLSNTKNEQDNNKSDPTIQRIRTLLSNST